MADILGLYSNSRSIKHWGRTCDHWRGQALSTDQAYEFDSQAEATRWLEGGQPSATARLLTSADVQQGCSCRRP